MNYPVTEIFHSLQGEGACSGRSAHFIRFAGCNLACTINLGGKEFSCDEPLHDDPTKSTRMTVAEILAKIVEPSDIVVITGGEPTMFDLVPLTNALNLLPWTTKHYPFEVEPTDRKGPLICIETNGTLPIRGDIDYICVSPKPSNMGRGGKEIPVLEENLRKANEIKLVVGWTDPFVVEEEVKRLKTLNPTAQIYLSPLTQFPGNNLIKETAELAVDLVKKLGHLYGVRLSLQTHKWLNIR